MMATLADYERCMMRVRALRERLEIAEAEAEEIACELIEARAVKIKPVLPAGAHIDRRQHPRYKLDLVPFDVSDQ